MAGWKEGGKFLAPYQHNPKNNGFKKNLWDRKTVGHGGWQYSRVGSGSKKKKGEKGECTA